MNRHDSTTDPTLRFFNPRTQAKQNRLKVALAAITCSIFCASLSLLGCTALHAEELGFVQKGSIFSFDTGVLSGTLRSEEQSRGLTSVVDSRTGAERVASNLGLFTLYRLFDSTTRYGDGRNRESRSKLLPNGEVEYLWPADANNPFEVRGIYLWADEQSLDLTLIVTAKKDLNSFETFLSIYLKGSDRSFVYAQGKPDGFVEARKSDGTWQLFARDAKAKTMVLDGRWKRGANPVDWAMRPNFAGALGLRRNTKTGSATLVMAKPSDCIAVSTPFGDENHHSLYLSLFGRDIKAGQTDTACARLILGHNLSDEQAIDLYNTYVK